MLKMVNWKCPKCGQINDAVVTERMVACDTKNCRVWYPDGIPDHLITRKFEIDRESADQYEISKSEFDNFLSWQQAG